MKYILLAIIALLLTAYIIDELAINDLEQDIQDKENTSQQQTKISNTNDSLIFQCRTKDIIILRLKSQIQTNEQPN